MSRSVADQAEPASCEGSAPLSHWLRTWRGAPYFLPVSCRRSYRGGPMAQKTVLVCDVCGDEPARTVTLRVAGANWQKDLCETHVTELLSGARRPRRGVRPGTKRTERAAPRTPRATSKRKGRPARQTRAKRSRRRASNRDVAAQVKK